MSDESPPFDPSALGDLGGLMGNLMGQVQQMQSKMKQMQEKLRSVTVTGQAGGGIVTVTANGAAEIVRIEIDPVAVDPRDIPMLEDLVVAATNAALTRAAEHKKQAMASVTGGVSLPGLTDLL